MNREEERLLRILGRHLRDEDWKLSDREFVLAVLTRFGKDQARPIIDVNE